MRAGLKQGNVLAKLALFMIMLLMVSTACGRKAPPEPPGRPGLPVIDNLTVKPENGSVIVEWTIRTTDAELLRNLSGFYVYRAGTEIEMADCKGCPLEYELISETPYGYGRTVPDSWFFRDDPPDGYAWFYVVRPFSNHKSPGKASEAARIILHEK